MGKKLEEIRQRRNGKVHRHVTKDQLPVTMDPILMDTSEQAATKFGYATMRLGSMAGHDAAHMATLTKAGMLFVPSIDGKSHCPEEESRKSDIEIVCNTLLHSILLLDQQLSKQFQLIYSK